MTLGNNLRQYREAKGLSQREVAEKANIHKMSYYRFEKDKLLPTSDTLKRLSLALNVSLDDLVLTEAEKNTLRVSNKELIEKLEKINQLPEKDRELLIHLINSLLSKNNVALQNKPKKPRSRH